MKIWIDFINEPEDDSYTHCRSLMEAQTFIKRCEKNRVKFKDMSMADELWSINLIDVLDVLYLDFLTWLKETNRHYKVVKHP